MGWEADDNYWYTRKTGRKKDYKVFHGQLPDKDFGQLVSWNIFMYRPARMGKRIEIWGIPENSKTFWCLSARTGHKII